MRTLLTILLTLLCIGCYAQSEIGAPSERDTATSLPDVAKIKRDSVLQQIKRLPLETRVDNIQKNLLLFSDQYRTGTVMAVVGIGFSLASSLLYANRKVYTDPKTGDVHDPKGALYGIYGGVVFSLVGTFIQIDAHKFIRAAGGYKTK